VQDCQALVSIEETIDLGDIRIDRLSRSLIVDRFHLVKGVDILDLQGRSVLRVAALTGSTIALNELSTGVYLFRMDTERGPVVKRLFVE
jgi:hypothetical protein